MMKYYDTLHSNLTIALNNIDISQINIISVFQSIQNRVKNCSFISTSIPSAENSIYLFMFIIVNMTWSFQTEIETNLYFSNHRI